MYLYHDICMYVYRIKDNAVILSFNAVKCQLSVTGDCETSANIKKIETETELW